MGGEFQTTNTYTRYFGECNVVDTDNDRVFIIDAPPRKRLSISRDVGSLALAISTSCDDIPASCISYLAAGSSFTGTGYVNDSDAVVRLFLVGEHHRQMSSNINIRFRDLERACVPIPLNGVFGLRETNRNALRIYQNLSHAAERRECLS